MQTFFTLSAPLQALTAGIFTWLATALGAAMVFLFKTIKRRIFDAMLGFAAGVMIAASCWSLLVPAFEFSGELGQPLWLWPVAGFLAGGIFLRLVDFVLPHLHPSLNKNDKPEGIKTHLKRSLLMVLAITMHNIPEGFAVGVAFGAAAAHVGDVSSSVTVMSAIALSLGIAIQNMPEGFAVAVPLRGEGLSRRKAFFWGQASAVVEPIAAFLGALLVENIRSALPFALSFAAGAMIFVVVEELIPEGQSNGHGHAATMGLMIGFAMMMILDVLLG
jgi:ZIP family zinc transporter